jgi:hypothetical protein
MAKVICEFCDEELDSRYSAMRRVLCWIEPGKKTGAKLIQEWDGWAHTSCIDIEARKSKNPLGDGPALF